MSNRQEERSGWPEKYGSGTKGNENDSLLFVFFDHCAVIHGNWGFIFIIRHCLLHMEMLSAF